jgi:hypothetical protein
MKNEQAGADLSGINRIEYPLKRWLAFRINEQVVSVNPVASGSKFSRCRIANRLAKF